MRIRRTLFLMAALLLWAGCPGGGEEMVDGVRIVSEPQVSVDLPDILERGRLIALTGYSANGYFLYKGQPLGFEYELLERLAEHLGVALEIRVVADMDEILNRLNEGEGDLVAHGLTVTRRRTRRVRFTDPHNFIRQMLVQRLPDGWRDMKRHEIDDSLITNPVHLINRTVHVRRQSAYYSRLVNLSEEIGGPISIVTVPGDVTTEMLIGQVAAGEIDLTVADENIALINRAYYDNIDVRTPISLPQRIAWAVRNNSPELADAINAWLHDIKLEPTYNVLYARYFKDKRFFRRRLDSEYFSISGDKLSPWDSLIQVHADSLDWDWKLLAAMIFQESRFDPRARSWIGARGLMQLMPRTGREFGAANLIDPAQNLRAGRRFLQWLQDYWRAIEDPIERIKFVLASYNTGQGHVADARRLAEKFGADPDRWEGNVATYLLKKSLPEFYNDPVVEFGYCRGEEPVQYVEEILERYRHYAAVIN